MEGILHTAAQRLAPEVELVIEEQALRSLGEQA
jgi:hypothetical protein